MTAVGADAGTRTGVLRVGTRASALARVQSGRVGEELSRALGRPAELVHVRTHGDRSRAPLSVIGGAGVFVSALRLALVDGRVDVAVHSLKDLPTAPAPGVRLAAVPPREDPRDALVARDGLRLADLPRGARVGTGSPRRAALLAGRGLHVVDIRGNVDSRLARVGADLDAVVVAAAGLRRLGRLDAATEVLDPDSMLPAPGQGALAVETRLDDPLGDAVAAALDDRAARLAVTAERALLARLEAGCSAPVAALAEPTRLSGDRWRLSVRAAAGIAAGAGAGDGTVVRASAVEDVRDVDSAVALGARLADRLRGEITDRAITQHPDPEAGAR